ncbi:HAMP domain-containing sensor histidine kinase [Kiloniella laminariae]|uniref:histidine kinase n=1 Tax=Kiloniella laminariae TaxID=454162 RepID=A0ABT4LHX4_9PROT|nr:HAMP domain-containing sensor histidine kinase [Kiloniella laminariae]MCZ4279961.1 HAMP domain-containing sensor histidine kinase [Kiloniella laminariae]
MRIISYSQTLRFGIIAGLCLITASVALTLFSRQHALNDLQEMAEENNVVLARALSNTLMDDHAAFIEEAHRLEISSLPQHEHIARLQQDVVKQIRNLPVVKVKIYDRYGLTVFSTDPAQIGDDKSLHLGYLAATGGEVVSALTYRDTFNSLEGVVENLDLLESYVPSYDEKGKLLGVFEIYQDITAFMAHARQSVIILITVVGSIFLILYLLLLFVVWRSERLTQIQNWEKLDLIKAASAAEARSKSKSEILANLSHEFRTPLNAILGFSETLSLQIFGPIGSPKYLEYLDDITSSGQHLLAVIEDVLNMSRIESGHFELEETDCNINTLITKSIKLVEKNAQRKNITISCELNVQQHIFRGDELHLKQALVNGLANAIKFTPEQGQVCVTAGQSPEGNLHISVTDTGIGIADEDIPLVLTPFGRVENNYISKAGGTGLGLPIAKALIELHGGTLTLSSHLGEGTTFCITLPCHRLFNDIPVKRVSGGSVAF